MSSLDCKSSVEHLCWSSNNHLAIATSQLTGKIWNGEIIIAEYTDQLKEKKRFPTYSGNTSVSWIGDKAEMFACAGDEGAIHIWTTNSKSTTPNKTLLEHDHIISSLDANKVDKETLLSASWDMSIKLWPAKSNNSSRTFIGHVDYIWSAKWSHKSSDIFASCSQDSTCKIWDQRQSASVATVSVGKPTFALDWNPFSEHHFAVGTQEGAVIIVDTRKPTEFLKKEAVHRSSIKSISFNQQKENVLATGSDDNKVSILSVSEKGLEVDRTIDSHKDFVRAVAWARSSPTLLATGSWDKTVALQTL